MDFEDDEFYEPDEYEEAMSNCCGHFESQSRDAVFVCGAAGSEDCDWDCPFSRDLGLTLKEIEFRDVAEMLAEERERIARATDAWFNFEETTNAR